MRARLQGTHRTFADRTSAREPQRRRTGRSRGQIIIIVAIAMVPLLGFVALGVDIGLVVVRYRQLQNAVDAATYAGMYTMATGIPGGLSPVSITRDTVRASIDDYLNRNIVSWRFVRADLLWGQGPDANDCLQGTPIRVPLSSASDDDLMTAHCLQVEAEHDYQPGFARVLPGMTTLTVSAIATAAATPVEAMSNLMPMAIVDEPNLLDGAARTPWGPQWVRDQVPTLTCVQWTAPPVPHLTKPRPACAGPDAINITKNYQGLLSFVGPPTPDNDRKPTRFDGGSSDTGCHWDNEHRPQDTSNQDKPDPPGLGGAGSPHISWRGFNNPPTTDGQFPGLGATVDHDLPAFFSHRPWVTFYQRPFVTAQQPFANDCSSETNTDQRAAPGWIEFGFNGVISSGSAAEGKGDFFVLIAGNLGENISGPLERGPCAGVDWTILIVPLFDAFADPTHSSFEFDRNSRVNHSIHIRRFAGFRVDCTTIRPASSITGFFTNAVTTSNTATAIGGTRQPGVPNVSVIQLVG